MSSAATSGDVVGKVSDSGVEVDGVLLRWKKAIEPIVDKGQGEAGCHGIAADQLRVRWRVLGAATDARDDVTGVVEVG
jgi:hypothetical protein